MPKNASEPTSLTLFCNTQSVSVLFQVVGQSSMLCGLLACKWILYALYPGDQSSSRQQKAQFDLEKNPQALPAANERTRGNTGSPE